MAATQQQQRLFANWLKQANPATDSPAATAASATQPSEPAEEVERTALKDVVLPNNTVPVHTMQKPGEKAAIPVPKKQETKKVAVVIKGSGKSAAQRSLLPSATPRLADIIATDVGLPPLVPKSAPPAAAPASSAAAAAAVPLILNQAPVANKRGPIFKEDLELPDGAKDLVTPWITRVPFDPTGKATVTEALFGDLLMIAEFMTSFSDLFGLDKRAPSFSFDALEGELCGRSEYVSVPFAIIALLQLVLGSSFVSDKKKYAALPKMDNMSFPLHLGQYLGDRDAKTLSETVAKHNFAQLDAATIIQLMSFLVNDAIELFADDISGAVETMIDKLKGEWFDKREKKAKEKAKLAAALIPGANAANAPSPSPAAVEETTDDNMSDADSMAGTDDDGNNESDDNDDDAELAGLSRRELIRRKKEKQAAKARAVRARREQERKAALVRDMELKKQREIEAAKEELGRKLGHVRVTEIGRDRHFRSYWIFSCLNNQVLVQSPGTAGGEPEQWFFVESETMMAKIRSTLNPKGLRERDLARGLDEKKEFLASSYSTALPWATGRAEIIAKYGDKDAEAEDYKASFETIQRGKLRQRIQQIRRKFTGQPAQAAKKRRNVIEDNDDDDEEPDPLDTAADPQGFSAVLDNLGAPAVANLPITWASLLLRCHQTKSLKRNDEEGGTVEIVISGHDSDESDESDQAETARKRKQPSATATASKKPRVALEDEIDLDNEEDENHDECSKCQKSGELLCCDRCPKSFHLSCLKPPLRRVPRGTWMCPSCVDASNRRVTRPRKTLTKSASRSDESDDDNGDFGSSDDNDNGSDDDMDGQAEDDSSRRSARLGRRS